jgi:hypothetical protein
VPGGFGVAREAFSGGQSPPEPSKYRATSLIIAFVAALRRQLSVIIALVAALEGQSSLISPLVAALQTQSSLISPLVAALQTQLSLTTVIEAELSPASAGSKRPESDIDLTVWPAEPGRLPEPEERLRLWQLYCDSAPFRRLQRESLHAYAEEIRRHGP